MDDDDQGNRPRLSRRSSATNLRNHRRRLSASSAREGDELSSLLGSADLETSYSSISISGALRPPLSRNASTISPRTIRAPSRLSKSLTNVENKLGDLEDERVWYDQVRS